MKLLRDLSPHKIFANSDELIFLHTFLLEDVLYNIDDIMP